MSEPVDIGHGVSIQVRHWSDNPPPDAGTAGGVAWWHECGTYGRREDWIPLYGRGAWKLDCLEPLTISPSVLCLVCNRHGFIRNGKWEPA